MVDYVLKTAVLLGDDPSKERSLADLHNIATSTRGRPSFQPTKTLADAPHSAGCCNTCIDAGERPQPLIPLGYTG